MHLKAYKMFFLNAFTTTYMIHIELDSQYTEAWSRKGDTLEALGRHQEAQMCYDKAKELGYRYENIHFHFLQIASSIYTYLQPTAACSCEALLPASTRSE